MATSSAPSTSSQARGLAPAGARRPRPLPPPCRRSQRHPAPSRALPEVDGVAAAGAGLLAVGLAGAFISADPEKRRQAQMAQSGGDERSAVRAYFNSEGFDRWRRIYGEGEDVNKVQLDIREGHAQTVEKALGWLAEGGGISGTTACDAGCGTGSLAIPMALMGARVSASDISSAMVAEAEARYKDAAANAGEAASPAEPSFTTQDLESISGKYDTVACLDVMIHYPQEQASGMIRHLAGLADKRLILSFAPKTMYYSVLKRVGELFPGPSKATRAYLHSDEEVEGALREAGWKVVRKDMTATSFYFSRLFEAIPM